MARAEIGRLSKLAQRAQREATGYYCGYTFKRQPVGTKYLKALGETYNHVADSYKAKTVTQQWHRISHRVLTDFQHRCMVRTAPEEWNLASQWHAQDPTAAEFVRLYRSVDFPGRALLDRVEMEEKNLRRKEIRKIIPQAHGRGSGPEDYAKTVRGLLWVPRDTPSDIFPERMGVLDVLGNSSFATARATDGGMSRAFVAMV